MKISKLKIIGILIVVIAILFSTIFILSRKDGYDSQVPLGNIDQLPTDLQTILYELEKDEYIGLSQSEIEKKLKEKGIEFKEN